MDDLMIGKEIHCFSDLKMGEMHTSEVREAGCSLLLATIAAAHQKQHQAKLAQAKASLPLCRRLVVLRLLLPTPMHFSRWCANLQEFASHS